MKESTKKAAYPHIKYWLLVTVGAFMIGLAVNYTVTMLGSYGVIDNTKVLFDSNWDHMTFIWMVGIITIMVCALASLLVDFYYNICDLTN